LSFKGGQISHDSGVRGAATQSQATFFLNGMLATFCERMKTGEAVFPDYPEYDPSHWVSNNFAYCSHPTNFLPMPVDDSLVDSFEYNEAIVQWCKQGMEAPVTGACVFCGDHSAAAHTCEKVLRLMVQTLLDEVDVAAKAAGLVATLNIVHCLLKYGPTGRRVRVLASQISRDGMPGRINVNLCQGGREGKEQVLP
jgi:hypothetical protein